MKPLFAIQMMLLLYIPAALHGKTNFEPICLTCETADLIADVYLVPPDGIQGQLISGQFYRIAGLFKEVEISFEDLACFLDSKGREFVKMGGGAYIIIAQGNRHYLAELIRKNESHFDAPKIVSMNEVINDAPFINVILPRMGMDIYNGRR